MGIIRGLIRKEKHKMQKTLREVYEKIVEEYNDKVENGKTVKASRVVILADRKFNDWIDNPDIDGAAFAKHHRAFVKFMNSFDPSFGEIIVTYKTIPADIKRKVSKTVKRIPCEAYSYHPEELKADNDFLKRLDFLVSSNAPFCLHMSAWKDCNTMSIMREHANDGIKIQVENEMDEIPEIFENVVWELYNRSMTAKELKQIENAYRENHDCHIRSIALKKQIVIGKTATEIIDIACHLFDEAEKDLNDQREQAKKLIKSVI